MAKKPVKKTATKKVAVINHLDSIANFKAEFNTALIDLDTNYDQFLNGKKVAGSRMRKSLQTIKKLAQEMRKSIQLQINELRGK